jgi:hypothetical protein
MEIQPVSAQSRWVRQLTITHKSLLLRSIRFRMTVIPEHVQELLQLSVWELSRAISQPKRGWIVSLQGASLEMCDLKRDFES